MGKKTPPKAPDPTVVGAAQTATNVTTATANAALQNINKYGPDGNQTYTIDGYDTVTDPTLNTTYQVPRYSQHNTLSAEGQKAYDQNAQAATNLATLGNNLSSSLGGKLKDNFTLGNKATEDRLMQLGRSRLDPQLADRKAALETQLSNQGIKLGSKAYAKAMEANTQGSNDAYNQLMLTGRAQANNEMLTEDNQRINQISALLNGGQVSQPKFDQYQGQQLPTVDYAGLVQQKYQNDVNRSNQSSANVGGILSGIGGLFALSDKNAKKNIKKVGMMNGHNIHEYHYKGESNKAPKRLGLMAQEVEKKMPAAVIMGSDGYRRVNYSMALGRGA
jgi:Chaperone of endosialidase